jgi:uncharacterized membrane protein
MVSAENSASPTQTSRLLAALAYPIWVVALVIVLTDMKKDPYVGHHGSVALYWAIAWVVVFIGWGIVASLPLLHWLFLLYPFLWPAFVISSIYYAVQSYQAKTFSIPIVSDLAQRHGH